MQTQKLTTITNPASKTSITNPASETFITNPASETFITNPASKTFITNPASKPSRPGEWSLTQIQSCLKRQLPPTMLKRLTDKGNAQYLPWYIVNQVLDKYCPGWTWEIKDTQTSRDRIFIVGRLTIPTSEGNVYRESGGTEELKRQAYDNKIGKYIEKEIAYGDPLSNAESMAFRRCAARFGLGLYLYQK
jgi:hypothetical protein